MRETHERSLASFIVPLIQPRTRLTGGASRMPLKGFGILWRPPGRLLKASVGVLGPLCCEPRVPYVEWRAKYSPTFLGVCSGLFWTILELFWAVLGPFWACGGGEGPVGAFLGLSWALLWGSFLPRGPIL